MRSECSIGKLTRMALLASAWVMGLWGAAADAAAPHPAYEILKTTHPLPYPRGDRLPLYLWPVMDIPNDSASETERLLVELDQRGLGTVTTWNIGQREASLASALRTARHQAKLGLPININATSCLHHFFNGDPRTAHLTADGEAFFDSSFDPGVKMGCPFALDFRRPAIQEQVEYFARAYHEQGLRIDFVFADWEIDGPIEWNGAWASSRRCQRCRSRIAGSDDFTVFQRALRTIRSELQRKVFAEVIKRYFPKALVGNYAVYPHDGYRYWFDYFEKPVEGAPGLDDQRAQYRPWFQEFPLTGYTFAMPVVYTWYPIFQWYDFPNTDYRWFYNMLLVASNAAQHTPAEIPIISFVHWHTTAPPATPDPDVKQFGEAPYQELLWHLLLRGVDGFFLWCQTGEALRETALLHPVYAESLQFKEILGRGTPVTFHVPRQPGPVVSGMQLGNQLLIRRTDFDDRMEPCDIVVAGQILAIPRLDGRCQLINLNL